MKALLHYLLLCCTTCFCFGASAQTKRVFVQIVDATGQIVPDAGSGIMTEALPLFAVLNTPIKMGQDRVFASLFKADEQ